LTDEIDRLKNKTFDIGEVKILNTDTETKLNDLINGSLNTINFTSFTAQVSVSHEITVDVNCLLCLSLC